MSRHEVSKHLKETFELYTKLESKNATSMNRDNFVKCCKDCEVVDNQKVREDDVKFEYEQHTRRGKQMDVDNFQQCLIKIGEKRFKHQNPQQILRLVEGKVPKT